MTDRDKQEALMVRYLLQLSTEDERAEVEEQFFSDPEYFDQLVAFESSLIDDYVTGRMPAEQRIVFERNLTPRQSEDAGFSRGLIEAIRKKSVGLTVTPGPELAGYVLPIFAKKRFVIGASIAALVLLAVTITLLFTSLSLSNRLSQSEIQLAELKDQSEGIQQQLIQERFQKEEIAESLKTEQIRRIKAESRAASVEPSDTTRQLSDFIRIQLNAAFISRGSAGAVREIPVADHIRWLRFEVSVKGYGKYESYRLTIKIPGGGIVFESDPSRVTASRKLAVNVPVERLKTGDYIAKLHGDRPGSPQDELQDYSFRISR